jgi:hypothetical protein
VTNHDTDRRNEDDSPVDPMVAKRLRLVLSEIAERYDPALPGAAAQRRPARWVSVAAAAIAVLGVAGIAAVATRQGNDTGPAGPALLPSAEGSAPGHSWPTERLLYPTVVAGGDVPELAVPELTVAGLEEGQRALVRAPDDTLYRVAAGLPHAGPAEEDPIRETRVVDGHEVAVDTDEQGSIGYSWVDGCVRTSVITGNDGATWGSERLDLLGALSASGSAVTLALPDGWTVIDQGTDTSVIQLVYDFEFDGAQHRLVLGQSDGASIAAFPGLSIGSLEPVTLSDGTPAWFESNGVPSSRLAFSRDGVAVWLWGEAGVDVDTLIAAAAQLAPAPSVWSALLGPSEASVTTNTVPAAPNSDSCGDPSLSIVSRVEPG